MLSQSTISYLKDTGYSYEEIQGIQGWILEQDRGETLSREEMIDFVNNELFAQYKQCTK